LQVSRLALRRFLSRAQVVEPVTHMIVARIEFDGATPVPRDRDCPQAAAGVSLPCGRHAMASPGA
jgi:hypothetical protein